MLLGTHYIIYTIINVHQKWIMTGEKWFPVWKEHLTGNVYRKMISSSRAHKREIFTKARSPTTKSFARRDFLASDNNRRGSGILHSFSRVFCKQKLILRFRLFKRSFVCIVMFFLCSRFKPIIILLFWQHECFKLSTKKSSCYTVGLLTRL